MDRQTAQRQAICAVFESTPRPLSPAEVLRLTAELPDAQRPGPGAGPEPGAGKLPAGVGQATVYRTIKALVEDGWLVSVDVPGEVQRYERADLPHHHHFRCRYCDRVYDIAGCAFDAHHVHLPRGFRMDDHEVWIYGRCKNCRSTQPSHN